MALQVAKGELRLDVDELGLEAAFEFSPDSEGGAEWTADALAKALSDARINGVPAKLIADTMQKFAGAKAPLRVTMARGAMPSSGLPEEAEWLPLETPVEYAAFQDKALAEAPPPELFRIRVERVSRERVVKKAGILPFLRGKEEKIVETEKIERKEPVVLDRKVQRSFWAPADTLVARLHAPKPGKAGKSVYGKPVPAPQDDDPAFYLGAGLERGKGEISTKAAGWVRIGSRWADLVPFAPHTISLRKSEDGTTLLLDLVPGDKRLPPPEAGAILAQAAELGIQDESLLPEEDIASALQKSVKGGQALKGYSLSNNRDAEIRIDLSPDRLKATLTLVKGRGNGKALQLAELSAALAEAKLKGIKGDKLKTDVLAFYKGNEHELRDYLLVEGKAPARGKDRSLGFSVAFLPEAQAQDYIKTLESDPSFARLVPSLAEFPLSSVNNVAVVKKGQEVARFSPPSLGVPGLDVQGITLPSLPGNDPQVGHYENVRFSKETLESEEDGLALVCEKEGETLVRVVPYRDAVIEIGISDNGMQAVASLEKEYGLGKDLSLEAAQEALKAAGVIFGIEHKDLANALAEARAGKAVKAQPVAYGKEPVPSGGWNLNWITRLASGAALTLRSDGSADFKNQDRATVVAEGQPILELLAIGREGQDGTDVYGKPVKPPKDPRASDPPEWDDTIREEKTESGDRRLVAAKSGELKFEKNKLSIDAAWKINDNVGPVTGNVRFPGPVAVSGSVLTGFALIAGGDVFIGGSIEAALVSADGAVRVTEGVKGAQRGTVRARTTIEAGFAEQAQLMAVGNITLKSSALLCVIKTNGKLTLAGDKGSLVGGQCRAKMGAELQNLGAENNSKTSISFGQDYLVKDAAEAEEREMERVKALILQADKTMREYERVGKDLNSIRQEKLKLVKLLEKRSMRFFQFNEKFEEHFSAEVVVRGTVYPGVVLESHNRFHEVRTKKQHVAFSFDVSLGRIVERPLS